MTTQSTRSSTRSKTKPAANNTESKPSKKTKKKLIAEKEKVVRDSFTMPQSDHKLIAELKEKALNSGMHVKKSELLRAGLRLLAKSTAAQLKRNVATLEKIKTGRPKKV